MEREPLRVASVFGTLLMGGDENRCLALARNVPRDRLTHRVVVVAEPDPDQRSRYGDMPARYAAAGVPVHFLGVPGRSNLTGWRRLASPVLLARAVRTLRSFLRSHRVQVVDARLPTGMLLGALATLGTDIALVGTDYFPDWWEGEGRWVRRTVFGRLDALVTDSAFMGGAFATHLGDRVHVIHNGIPEPRSALDRVEARRALGLPARDDYPVLTQVSRLVPYKGQQVSLAAAAKVMAAHPTAHLVLCGFDGLAPGFADTLREEARALGIADRVRVGGWQGPVADVWAASDIALQPTWRDSSPIAIHEAMSLGLPAVVTRIAGLPELVDDGTSGFVREPGDVDGVATAIDALLRDPDAARRMGRAARARWEARHRPEHMVEATERVLHLARQRRTHA